MWGWFKKAQRAEEPAAASAEIAERTDPLGDIREDRNYAVRYFELTGYYFAMRYSYDKYEYLSQHTLTGQVDIYSAPSSPGVQPYRKESDAWRLCELRRTQEMGEKYSRLITCRTD